MGSHTSSVVGVEGPPKVPSFVILGKQHNTHATTWKYLFIKQKLALCNFIILEKLYY